MANTVLPTLVAGSFKRVSPDLSLCEAITDQYARGGFGRNGTITVPKPILQHNAKRDSICSAPDQSASLQRDDTATRAARRVWLHYNTPVMKPPMELANLTSCMGPCVDLDDATSQCPVIEPGKTGTQYVRPPWRAVQTLTLFARFARWVETTTETTPPFIIFWVRIHFGSGASLLFLFSLFFL